MRLSQMTTREKYNKIWDVCQKLKREIIMYEFGYFRTEVNDFKQGIFYRLPKKWRKHHETRRLVSKTVETFLGYGQSSYKVFYYRNFRHEPSFEYPAEYSNMGALAVIAEFMN